MPSKYLLALITPTISLDDLSKRIEFWEEATPSETRYALKLAGQLELLS